MATDLLVFARIDFLLVLKITTISLLLIYAKFSTNFWETRNRNL